MGGVLSRRSLFKSLAGLLVGSSYTKRILAQDFNPFASVTEAQLDQVGRFVVQNAQDSFYCPGIGDVRSYSSGKANFLACQGTLLLRLEDRYSTDLYLSQPIKAGIPDVMAHIPGELSRTEFGDLVNSLCVTEPHIWQKFLDEAKNKEDSSPLGTKTIFKQAFNKTQVYDFATFESGTLEVLSGAASLFDNMAISYINTIRKFRFN